MSQEAVPQPANEGETVVSGVDFKAPSSAAFMGADVEPDVLFSDPVLTAWWWDSHSMLTNKQRHELAHAIYPYCTSKACQIMIQTARAELDQYFAPVSAFDAFMVHGRKFCRERPAFAALAMLGMAGLFIRAGMGIWNLLVR